LSSRPAGHGRFGAISVLAHAAVIGALLLSITPPLPPSPPDEAPIQLVFEQPVSEPEATPQSPETPPPPPETAMTRPFSAEPPAEPPTPRPAVIPPPPEPMVIQPPAAEPPPRAAVIPPPPEPPVVQPPPPEPPAPEPKSLDRPPVPKPPPPRPRPTPRPAERPAERTIERAASPPRETPLPPAVAATPPPAPATPIIDPRWQAAVSSLLTSRKIYPEEARRRGEEGRVAVRFTIDRSGRVVDAAIVTASGSSLLDEAALALLRQAVLPPFPVDMTQARLTITTTIRYTLR